MKTCPYCGNEECAGDFYYAGNGEHEASPAECDRCGAEEIAPYDDPAFVERPKGDDWEQPSAMEFRHGWWAPTRLLE